MSKLSGLNLLAQRPHPARASSFSILGFRVHALTAEDIVVLVSHAVNARQQRIIANHNLHSLYLCHHVARMVDFYSIADYTFIDGMSLILLGRLFALPFKRGHRTTSLDFMSGLLPEAARQGWRMYYLGSRRGVAERAVEQLRKSYPNLEMRTHYGYFNPENSGSENGNVVADIQSYAPHILFVGMGMPRQEIWILENYKNIGPSVIFPIGAYVDYVAGEIPTPPRWLARLGFEWLYRLISEPTRLWRRYLIEPWFVAGRIARQYLSLRRVAEKSEN